MTFVYLISHSFVPRVNIVVVVGSLGAGWLCCVHLLHSSVVTLRLYRAVSFKNNNCRDFFFFLIIITKCGHPVLTGCSARPGCVLTVVGLGCHWRTALAELGERFIAESPWFYETAAVWSRSPSADRVTTVLLKAPTSHAFREMKFIVSQL